ncbi:MAG: 2-oxoacid:acceptor oxidoreductase family protein, partial [Alphaproteobacteria bacterium]|nr:2-oxoacid:acceptor oxidoreductase family protein [Alphaproteobacteria bacterium]
DGRRVAQSQHYEPTSRGGLSRSDVVIDSETIDYPLVVGLDALVVLDEVAVAPSLPLLRPSAEVIADAGRVEDLPGIAMTSLPLLAAARELGNPRVTNIVALGALASVLPLGPRECFDEAIRQEMPRRLHDINLRALALGHDLAVPTEEVRRA